jgi:hypothetical protein
MPARGIQGTRGVRKVRRTSGRVRRSTMIARQMIIKAESVPMFTNSATSLIGKKPATRAVSPPAISIRRCSVRNRGCTCANHAGSSPSRLMANQMRVQPSRKASMTLAIPATAAADTMSVTQGRPIAVNEAATGQKWKQTTCVCGLCPRRTIPCQKIDPRSNSLFGRKNSLFGKNNSLFHLLGNFAASI